jgi:hypothetical protein
MFYYEGRWFIGDDYPPSSFSDLYYIYSSDPDSPGWSYGSGLREPPTVTKAQISTGEKTWSGYKAVLTDGVYSFEETITPGLEYGTAFTPRSGGIYDAQCTLMISGLWMRMPTDGLFFYTPLATDMTDVISSATPKEQSNGVIIQDGAAMFPENSTNYIRYSAPLSENQQPDTFALSIWLKYYNYAVNNTPVLFGTSLNESQTSFFRFTNENTFKLGAQSTSGVQVTLSESAPKGQFNHILVNFSGSNYTIYVNGKIAAVIENSTAFALSRDLWLGSYYGYDTDHSFHGEIKSFRLYDRAVTADEIKTLAGEFSA